MFHCPSDNDPIPTAIESAAHNMENSSRVSYEFYSVFFVPENPPRLNKLKDAPLVWDLNVNPQGTFYEDQNHGSKGGNVLHADGSASWQEANLWDNINWPHPAEMYFH
jgi:prepilin-type processing-associated H-X9-DG protein